MSIHLLASNRVVYRFAQRLGSLSQQVGLEKQTIFPLQKGVVVFYQVDSTARYPDRFQKPVRICSQYEC